MQLLVLVALMAVVTAKPQVVNQPFQFRKTDGANFVYGYAFPQYQTPGSNVNDLNVYDQPTFLARPVLSLGPYAQNPVAPPVVGLRSLPLTSSAAGVPVANQQEYPSSEDRVRSSLTPMLRLAVNAGFVRASGSSQTGSPQYEVSEDLAKDAGSVSELAYRLGAIPVAAVHDVQMRPNTIISEESFSPVLVHKELPQVTRYTLEVPIQ